jgi:hypothetical protein
LFTYFPIRIMASADSFRGTKSEGQSINNDLFASGPESPYLI